MKIDSPTFLTETTFISASVQFSSGSQKFGNTSDDIHQFTGSVSFGGPVTASSNISGSSISTGSFGRLAVSGLNIIDNNAFSIGLQSGVKRIDSAGGGTDVYRFIDASDNITGIRIASANVSDKLFLKTDGSVSGSSTSTGSFGRVHIGNSGTTPSQFANNLVINQTTQSTAGISILTSNSGVGRIYFGDVANQIRAYIIYDHGNDIMKFSSVSGNRLTLTDTVAEFETANYKISGSATSTGSFGELQVRGAGQEKISLFGNAQQFINFGDAADSNTGMIQYDHNNNQLQFYANATNILRVLGSGFVLPGSDGTVSLGSTTRKWKELVVNHVSASGNISGSSTSTGSFGAGYIDNKLGIGTTSPVAKLVVSNGGGAGIELHPEIVTDTNRITNYDRAASAYMSFRLDALTQQFLISGTEKVRLDSTGLGIGTNNPDAILTTQSETVHFKSSGGESRFVFKPDTNANQAQMDMYKPDGSTIGVHFDAYGNSYFNPTAGGVGIGTTTPGVA